MILHLLPLLNRLQIVLASASPRRLQLLTSLGLTSITVLPSNFPETLPHHEYTPASYAIATSQHKALDVFARHRSSLPLHLLLSADTVVVDSVDGRDVIVEKPASAAEAWRMLASWSNRSHRVVTGVTLLRRGPGDDGSAGHSVDPVLQSFSVETTVHFMPLSAAVIDAYVATGEPMDKAGGYGVQGGAAALIRGVTGDYYNVVGLPLSALCEQLLTFTAPLLQGMEGTGEEATTATEGVQVWQEMECPQCHVSVAVPNSVCSTPCASCTGTVLAASSHPVHSSRIQ